MSEKLIVLAAAIQAKASTTTQSDALDHLAKAADCFDQAGLRREADAVSSLIKKLALHPIQEQYSRLIEGMLNEAFLRNTRAMAGDPDEVGAPRIDVQNIDYIRVKDGNIIITVHGNIGGGAGMSPMVFENILRESGREVQRQMRAQNTAVVWGKITSNQIPTLLRHGPARKQPEYEIEIGPARIDDENDARVRKHKHPTPKERETFRYYGFLSDKDFTEDDEEAAWEDEE